MQVSYSKLQLHSTGRSHTILLIRARITLLSLLMMRCELHGDRYDALDHIQHHRSLLFLFFVIKHFPQISYFQVKSAVMRAETELDKTYVSLTQNDWATMEKVELFFFFLFFFFFFLFFFPSDCENVVLALPCHKNDDGASHGVSHSS